MPLFMIQMWVYGRGAIDDKHSVFGILEALEYTAVKGERPERTVYVAFGHDEVRVSLVFQAYFLHCHVLR